MVSIMSAMGTMGKATAITTMSVMDTALIQIHLIMAHTMALIQSHLIMAHTTNRLSHQ